ncbi:MAG: SRPBCC domain-containing protein [Bacteroidota bacterium]
MLKQIENSLLINARPSLVWEHLTNLELMKKWMGEPEMKIEVHTNWKINSPILINVFHHIQIVTNGFILQYEKERKLKYSHLSSISELADIPENYTIIEFSLKPTENKTHLTINIENFPTETIYKHLELYWRTTIFTIKTEVEKQVKII